MLGTIFYHIFYVLSIGFMRKNKFFCYITIDVLNEAGNSPLHLTRYFYGGDRYAK